MRHPLLLCLLLPACSDYDLQGPKDDPEGESLDDTAFDPGAGDELACAGGEYPVEDVGSSDACDYAIGGFEPIVEWEVEGTWVCSLPAVGDLDRDGMPDIVVNNAGLLTPGELAAYRGDGSGTLWTTTDVNTGFGSHPTIADIDGDGYPEILIVREYANSLLGPGDYSVVMLDSSGSLVAESERFVDAEFDYATGIAVSDMDHDGSPEIVAGRVILDADLATRGVGEHGRGCVDYFGEFSYDTFGIYGEGTNSAIADMDLDGTEEVVVGDAFYDPDGNTVMSVRGGQDGAVGIGNFDDDPEGEFVRVTFNEVAAYDTDGSLLWGPITNRNANIMSVPTIGDVDADGRAEIVVAGGNAIWVLNAEDGTQLWTAAVHDQTGATGASLFDFDADGVLEVVYIDELQMFAFNGTDGTIKFWTDEHASDTMYDYPTIADVDADGHAEIVVAHDGFFRTGLSVYGDATDSWAPARQVWNQHAYTITNINDDLSVPVTATPNFTTYNSFHSALPLVPGESLGDELEAEILGICEDDCDRGWLAVYARGRNTGNADLPAGVNLALYARAGGADTLVGTAVTATETPAGRSTEAVRFDVEADAVAGADALWVYVDDDGTGTGYVAECVETNNGATREGPFCR